LIEKYPNYFISNYILFRDEVKDHDKIYLKTGYVHYNTYLTSRPFNSIRYEEEKIIN